MQLLGGPTQQRKSLEVATLLLVEIRQGKWSLGARLPGERELAEQLGVSRTVIREALGSLQMLGVIERKVGDGTYLAKLEPGHGVSLMSTLETLTGSINLVEALEAREALDISVAQIIINDDQQDSLAEADKLIAEMRNAVLEENYGRYIDLSLDFHALLAKRAGNAILEQAVTFLIEIIRPHLWIIERNYNRRIAERSLEIHNAILQGIRGKDLGAVIDAMRQHYREYPSLHQ